MGERVQRVRPRPEGDPACGPYFHYIDDEAEQARRATYLSLPEEHAFAHERRREVEELTQIAATFQVPAAMFPAVVQAFYAGRHSMMREGPTAEQTRRAAVMSLKNRFSAAVTRAVMAELNYGHEHEVRDDA